MKAPDNQSYGPEQPSREARGKEDAGSEEVAREGLAGVHEMAGKKVFTTGEAAVLCGLSQQTIIRCFDAGRIIGFKVPGSRFRRIPRAALLRFMRLNGLSMDQLLRGPARACLLVTGQQAVADGVVAAIASLATDGFLTFEVKRSGCAFDAGLWTATQAPTLLILDTTLTPDLDVTLRLVRAIPALAGLRIMCIGDGHQHVALFDSEQNASAAGYRPDEFLQQTADPSLFAMAIAAAMRRLFTPGHL